MACEVVPIKRSVCDDLEIATMATERHKPTIPMTQAAEMIGVTGTTIRRWVDQGKLKAVGSPPRVFRWSVDKYLSKSETHIEQK